MPAFTILTAITGWIVATTGLCLFLNDYHWNALTGSLFFFNNLNILIALCEIILGWHIDLIQKDYKQNMKLYKGREWQCGLNFLKMPLPNPFSSAAWSKMWSTYALYDPSYQNIESFGFFIDVGNGWSTIPPCLIINWAMIRPEQFSHVLVASVGIASYWQICYGTIIYLLSYIYNRRYVGKTLLENVGFVGVANIIWFVFPIVGLRAFVQILEDGSLEIFFNDNDKSIV